MDLTPSMLARHHQDDFRFFQVIGNDQTFICHWESSLGGIDPNDRQSSARYKFMEMIDALWEKGCFWNVVKLVHDFHDFLIFVIFTYVWNIVNNLVFEKAPFHP